MEPRIETSEGRRLRKFDINGAGNAFALGLLIAVLGVIALSSTVITGLLSVLFLGVVLAVSGAVQAAYGIRSRNLPHVLGSVLALVVGGLLMFRTAAGLAAVTFLLAGYFFASGLFRAIHSLMERPPRWGLNLLYGIVSLLLGIGVMASWPASSLWLVGTMVGLEILFRGISLMMEGMAIRRASKPVHLETPVRH